MSNIQMVVAADNGELQLVNQDWFARAAELVDRFVVEPFRGRCLTAEESAFINEREYDNAMIEAAQVDWADDY